MGLIAVAALIEDHLLNAGMWNALGSNGQYLWFAGLVGFVLIGGFASVSSHRGFSHSLLALALFAGSLWLVFPAMTIPFAITFASHLILDLLNKKSLRLFYPAEKGICLGMFYCRERVAGSGSYPEFEKVIGCLHERLIHICSNSNNR